MPAFRYSGSKTKLLPLYPHHPQPNQRVVELYLGSGAASLHYSPNKTLGYELNGDVASIWHWLQTASRSDLERLKELWKAARSWGEKFDLRSIPDLPVGALNYLRVNISGLMVGQLSSWIAYPQHSLPVDGTLEVLDRIKEIEVVHGDGLLHEEQPGDWFFVDPPYLGTAANYKDKGSKTDLTKVYDPKDTVHYLKNLRSPWLMTYGDGCQEVFPEFEWHKVAEKKVPLVRTGGVKIRSEFYATNME